MNRVFLVRYGEIALKGLNRHAFENVLVSNIKNALRANEVNGYKVEKEHGRIFVYCIDASEYPVQKVLEKAFGIVSFSKAVITDATIENINSTAIEVIKPYVEGKQGMTFKIDTKRANKSFPMQSPEISREIGGKVLETYPQLKVDVHHPLVTLTVEIREYAYVFMETFKGQGGMPYGTAGKGVLLLSGGIDSPVAGYMMAKRGLALTAVHFHSYPYTSERAFDKIMTLGKKLKAYTGSLKVYSVNLLSIQKAIAENCPSEEMTILARRFMMQIAERVAIKVDAKALVTGESLGQVASQTLEGLTVTNAAVTLPVFRPLIAFDKTDIIDIAMRIDTFDTSILPFEDCCTVFLPDRVVTRPKQAAIEKSQNLLDSELLIREALANLECFDL